MGDDWCAADRRPGPRVFSGLQLSPVLLQRLTLVFLMLDHAWLPCQASITSQLFRLFIIQRLSWSQALGFPKQNCFYAWKWKKGCLPRVRVLHFYEEVKFNLLPLCLSRVSALFSLFRFLFLCVFICCPDRNSVRRNTNPQQTTIILGRKARNFYFSFWANT